MTSRVDPVSVTRARWAGSLTWVVLALTFIGLLGGLHPSDRSRNIVVVVAAVMVLGLNVPTVSVLVARTRAKHPWRVVVLEGLGLCFRLVAAVMVLDFVVGISHEGR